MNHLQTQQSSPTPPNLTQQFCLRWHNHQTSLLTSLPLLLDQSHLTDVTLSAEGRTVRAHRVVLSACSSFFSELFRTLDAPFHPVIVIPGATFGSIVSLLTFMYSGEVNVFEEQISTLLSLAETLGIKGLADINGKNQMPDNESMTKQQQQQSQSPPPAAISPTSPSPPAVTNNNSMANSPTKFALPLESMLAKTFQLCPSMLTNPLNLSPTALSRGAELLTRYQNQCRLNQMDQKHPDSLPFDENGNSKNFLNIETKGRKSKLSDTRKIDKIAENLRSSSKDRILSAEQHAADHLNKLSMVPQNLTIPMPIDMKAVANFNVMPNRFGAMPLGNSDDLKVSKECMPNLGATSSSSSMNDVSIAADATVLKKSLASTPTPPLPMTPKQSNSKLYATCFICHKQLSNQYNLRVHLETHQNVRYACSVCSHVSRSKDALRKHVSYRHPGAPSPCDESKRKRARNSISVAMMQSQMQSQMQQHQQQQQQQQQQLQQKGDAPASSPSSSSSSLVSSPVVIKNEIVNDLSMTSTAQKLHEQSTSPYPHQQMLQSEPINATGSPLAPSSVQTTSPSASSCFLMRSNIDTGPTKRV